jgi:hypothetical protein
MMTVSTRQGQLALTITLSQVFTFAATVNVSWYDAMAYAVWLVGTLPTEAQWEFTARGEDHRRYPWDLTGRTEPDLRPSQHN